MIWTDTNDMPLKTKLKRFCTSIFSMPRKHFEVSFGGTLLDIWPFCAIYFTAQNNREGGKGAGLKNSKNAENRCQPVIVTNLILRNILTNK